jgi:hypothetical protein
MALWGKLDQGAVTGTVVLTNGSASIVANSSTTLGTTVKVGDVVFLSTANTAPGTNTRYRVASVVNSTAITVSTTYAGTTNAAATLYYQQSPKDLNNSYVGRSLANKQDIVGVDVTEARVSANRANGLKTPGWINYVVGSGGRAGRKQVETLVAMRSMTSTAASDANDDTVAADS